MRPLWASIIHLEMTEPRSLEHIGTMTPQFTLFTTAGTITGCLIEAARPLDPR